MAMLSQATPSQSGRRSVKALRPPSKGRWWCRACTWPRATGVPPTTDSLSMVCADNTIHPQPRYLLALLPPHSPDGVRWFLTGDRGVLTEDGELYIVGRMNRLVTNDCRLGDADNGADVDASGF